MTTPGKLRQGAVLYKVLCSDPAFLLAPSLSLPVFFPMLRPSPRSTFSCGIVRDGTYRCWQSFCSVWFMNLNEQNASGHRRCSRAVLSGPGGEDIGWVAEQERMKRCLMMQNT